jgi:hypothetical protein
VLHAHASIYAHACMRIYAACMRACMLAPNIYNKTYLNTRNKDKRSEMANFTISDYLSERNKAKNQGKCKLCEKIVYWTRNRVASHKRSSCSVAFDEENRKFAKRSATFLNASGSNNSIETEDDEMNQDAECTNCYLTAEKIKVINSLFGTCFYRTGISLRLADSNALKNLMKEVNPTYAA